MALSIREPNPNTSLVEYIQTTDQAWEIANVNVYLRPTPVLEVHRLEVRCLAPWDSGNTGLCKTPADFVPVVTVPGLPATRYPEFATALIGPTLACLRIEHPRMWIASNTTDLIRVVTAVVAARAGFWSAVNWVPEPCPSLPPKALVYDNKRRNLWLARSSGVKEHDSWLAIHALGGSRMKNEGEVVRHLSAVSPVLALTGAVALTQSGPAYTVGLMLKQVAKVLRARMSELAFRELGITDKFVSDALRFGPLTGALFAAARRWAADPLAAVLAQQRVAVTQAERSELKAQEADLLSGISTPVVASSNGLDEDEVLDDPLMVRVREHMMQQYDAQAPDEPTLINGGYDTPRPGTPQMQVIPPRPGTVIVPQMTADDANMIRDVAAAAAVANPPAPSALMGANPEESVIW